MKNFKAISWKALFRLKNDKIISGRVKRVSKGSLLVNKRAWFTSLYKNQQTGMTETNLIKYGVTSIPLLTIHAVSW